MSNKFLAQFKFKQPMNMATDPIPKVIVHLAVPMMVSLFFQNLYAFADTIFVSWLGEIPLAAVSMSVPLTYLALSIGKGVAMGSTVLISHARGAGNERDVTRLGRSILSLMTLVMLPFLILLLPTCSNAFFMALGAEQGIVQEAYWFTFFLVLGFPIMGYNMTTEAIFMGHGNTLIPMQGMVLGNIINLVLDPLFIFVFQWGCAGAAVATLLSQMVVGIFLWWLLKRKLGIQLSLFLPSGFSQQWKAIASHGVFVTLAYLSSPVSLILINGLLAQFGPTAVGAWTLMSRTEMLVMLPVMGMSNALAVFISFSLGQGDFARIQRGLVFFIKLSFAVVLPVAFLFSLFPREIISVFRPVPGLIALASHAVFVSSIAMPFGALLYAFFGLAQGLKRPFYMTIVTFIYLAILRVPMAYFFAQYWGVEGVYWSHAAAVAVGAALAVVLGYSLLTSYTKKAKKNIPC